VAERRQLAQHVPLLHECTSCLLSAAEKAAKEAMVCGAPREEINAVTAKASPKRARRRRKQAPPPAPAPMTSSPWAAELLAVAQTLTMQAHVRRRTKALCQHIYALPSLNDESLSETRWKLPLRREFIIGKLVRCC
jgi:hypothetical protein